MRQRKFIKHNLNSLINKLTRAWEGGMKFLEE